MCYHIPDSVVARAEEGVQVTSTNTEAMAGDVDPQIAVTVHPLTAYVDSFHSHVNIDVRYIHPGDVPYTSVTMAAPQVLIGCNQDGKGQ